MTAKRQHTLLSTTLFKVAALAVAFLLLPACSGDGGISTDRDAGAEASYKVTFTTAWTDATFPVNFPSGAHFSGLIGGTHNDQVKFWEKGQIATDGIEIMAETGAQGALSAEVEAAKKDGKAEFVLAGGGNSAAGSVELTFDINQSYPLVTLVSMVAPSPDWFVGVRDLELFDDTVGDWKQSVVVELAVYDAGSDSGQVFTAANSNSVPAEPILLLGNPVMTGFVEGFGPAGEIIATMTFERIK